MPSSNGDSCQQSGEDYGGITSIRFQKPYRLALKILAQREKATMADVLRKLIEVRMRKVDPRWTPEGR